MKAYPKTENENQVHPSEPTPCAPPASIVTNGNGNSTSASFSWSKITNNKEVLLTIVLIMTVCILGYALSRIQFYEDKYTIAAKELADENRLKRNHADDLSIDLRAAQAVLALTRCKP
jgi:hypothetical protein